MVAEFKFTTTNAGQDPTEQLCLSFIGAARLAGEPEKEHHWTEVLRRYKAQIKALETQYQELSKLGIALGILDATELADVGEFLRTTPLPSDSLGEPPII